MESISLKAVVADIDITGTLQVNRVVGIRYVNQSGEISDMLVSKRVRAHRKKKPAKKTATPNMKATGLIPIIDHTDEMKPKDIFMYGILFYAPEGDFDQLMNVKVA